MNKPILSIVIPTRDGITDFWVKQLLKVQGDVEFILVHPPELRPVLINDPRVRQINSPLRGEIVRPALLDLIKHRENIFKLHWITI
jgi:hypothetical protein